jgi:hypothetical protein
MGVHTYHGDFYGGTGGAAVQGFLISVKEEITSKSGIIFRVVVDINTIYIVKSILRNKQE